MNFTNPLLRSSVSWQRLVSLPFQHKSSRVVRSLRPFSSFEDLGPNPGLASVISQGIKSLQDTASDVEARTRHVGIEPKSKEPTYRQLAESQRMLEVANECLEDLCMKQQQQRMRNSLPGLELQGEPIVLLDVLVNKEVKLAKVYWTLPYSVLLDPNVTQGVYQKLMEAMQGQLIQQGGAKILAREVGSKLRFYYPPRIKLVPAKDEMVREAIAEFHE